MKHCYSLFSGGLDSTLAILKTMSGNEPVRVIPIFFDYGQKAVNEETRAVLQLVPRLREFGKQKNPDTQVEECKVFKIRSSDADFFSWSKSAILEGRPESGQIDVENRNMVLVSCALSVIMSERATLHLKGRIELTTGFLNEFYDTSSSFTSALTKLLHVMNQPVEVVTPLMAKDQKGRVSVKKLVDIAHSLEVLSLLKNMTWSCYYPTNGIACDRCKACDKRRSFFRGLGMKKVKRKPERQL
jgi:7-cyano-7-deazaguanine synthase in queuosine biosynthesis